MEWKPQSFQDTWVDDLGRCFSPCLAWCCPEPDTASAFEKHCDAEGGEEDDTIQPARPAGGHLGLIPEPSAPELEPPEQYMQRVFVRYAQGRTAMSEAAFCVFLTDFGLAEQRAGLARAMPPGSLAREVFSSAAARSCHAIVHMVLTSCARALNRWVENWFRHGLGGIARDEAQLNMAAAFEYLAGEHGTVPLPWLQQLVSSMELPVDEEGSDEEGDGEEKDVQQLVRQKSWQATVEQQLAGRLSQGDARKMYSILGYGLHVEHMAKYRLMTAVDHWRAYRVMRNVHREVAQGQAGLVHAEVAGGQVQLPRGSRFAKLRRAMARRQAVLSVQAAATELDPESQVGYNPSPGPHSDPHP